MNIDYHMHTTLSDGHNTHEEMVLTAIEKGFDEIGFSDHFCIKQPCKWAVGAASIGLLEEKISEMRAKYGDQINILFGIEVDYFADKQEEIRESLQPFNFDYVLGSVHFLDDWNYDTDKSRYEEFSNDFLYEWYFRELQNAAKSGLFDIMAHPDLIKKFRIWPETSKKQLFEETARIFAESGVAFEINTSGNDRPCGEFFPGNELLEAFCKAGVPVTIGSDSHAKEQIGRHFGEARTILKQIGYNNITRFRIRERTIVTI
ncbi:MAG TPA: histidinol-phosphatase HisJ family protein [Prolixibacteraceae bacterium]|nr:histidinol-phosphatase HisJ family protein [Prolixibacteraceae bacterium]